MEVTGGFNAHCFSSSLPCFCPSVTTCVVPLLVSGSGEKDIFQLLDLMFGSLLWHLMNHRLKMLGIKALSNLPLPCSLLPLSPTSPLAASAILHRASLPHGPYSPFLNVACLPQHWYILPCCSFRWEFSSLCSLASKSLFILFKAQPHVFSFRHYLLFCSFRLGVLTALDTRFMHGASHREQHETL